MCIGLRIRHSEAGAADGTIMSVPLSSRPAGHTGRNLPGHAGCRRPFRPDTLPAVTAVPASDANTISLSLVSHTNVGKTTLARTLLSENVGEVRDEPHVTDTADRHELAETPQGDLLLLWDTPGFGDSARLAKRLLQSDKPIGWFVSQVWDRFADRALWSSQQAVHNVREEADVVLYLVNAAENPEDAGYVEPEMKILAWIGKPIIVLLNQMGPPASHHAEEAEIDRWRTYLTRFGNVHQVLALDAFARCWVQEGALLQAVEPLLPQAKRESFARLHRLWQNQRRQTFDRSMHILAERLAATALDRERIPNSSLKDQLREVGKVLGVSRQKQDDPKQVAMNQLAERLNTAIRHSTDELITTNGLTGHAADEVLSRMADHYDVTENLNEGHAAMVGGIVTGALAGLKADFLSGGLTLGGGMIAGGVLGALGGAGLARGYNMVRGIDAITVTWTDAVMNRLVQSALLTYLAVAHYGRGRGDWAESEHPAHWEKTVTDVLARQHEQFTQFWRKRQNFGPDRLTADLQTELTLAMERILIRLYPNALSMAALGSGAKRLNIALAADLAEARGEHEQARKASRKQEEPPYAAELRAGFAAGRTASTARLDTPHHAPGSTPDSVSSGNIPASSIPGSTTPAGSTAPPITSTSASGGSSHRSPPEEAAEASENSLLEGALGFFGAAGDHADKAGAPETHGVNSSPSARSAQGTAPRGSGRISESHVSAGEALEGPAPENRAPTTNGVIPGASSTAAALENHVPETQARTTAPLSGASEASEVTVATGPALTTKDTPDDQATSTRHAGSTSSAHVPSSSPSAQTRSAAKATRAEQNTASTRSSKGNHSGGKSRRRRKR